jgi:hypothetical protein
LAGDLLSGKFIPDGTGSAGSGRASFDFPVEDKPCAFAVVDLSQKMMNNTGNGSVVKSTPAPAVY